MNVTDRLLLTANMHLLKIILIAGFAASAASTNRALAEDGMFGCTPAQVSSAAGVDCGKKMEQDITKHYTNVHTLRCTSGRIECCIRSKDGNWSGCELAKTAPRDSTSIPKSPPAPEVVCASLESARGEWKPDARSIKANSDNKTCSQAFICGAPEAKQLSAEQRRCRAVVSVSNKQVTQSGTCVPGSKPGTCSSCLAKPPNEPCTVAFAK
jgi:hypothetical protein